MQKISLTEVLNRYYKISIVVVLCIGIFATYLTYQKTVKETKEELLTNVSIIANTLNPNEIKNLTGKKDDLNNPNYIAVKNKLEKINSLNDENRFLYLWNYKNGDVIFLADSEPTSSDDYSPPGQVYDEATDLDRNVLLGIKKNGIEFSKDRWGHWLTALVPILDENQNIIAVLGIDMDAAIYFKNIYNNVAIPLLSTIFVLIIIIVGLILKQKENQYLDLKEKLLSTARHELRAPLTNLSWLTETMLDEKNELKEEQKNNLKTVHQKVIELIKNVNNIIDNQKS